MASLLASVRAAVWPGSNPHDLDDVEEEPGAAASTLEPPPPEASPLGGIMSVNEVEAGAAGATPVATANSGGAGNPDSIAAVASVMSAEAINGDAGRMSAAIALMALAPSLSAETVTAYVTKHVPAASAAAAPVTAPALSYDDRRVEAARLAMPNAGAGQEDPVKRILGNFGAVTGR